MHSAVRIIPAQSADQIATIRDLFREYADALDVDLSFQNFDHELATLPGEYAPPAGRIFLAEFEGAPVGCIALRKIDASTCEMKRLYVRPQVRGKKVGLRLAEYLIEEARQMGYTTMRLDTISHKMPEAVHLYRQLGFYEIPAYRLNPFPDTLYLQLDLKR